MTGPEATYLSSQTAHIEMLDISVLLKKTTKLNSQLSLSILSRRLKKKLTWLLTVGLAHLAVAGVGDELAV